MMRSLFSGVSGIKVHQTRMDVIGNNIANINTIGFKGSRTTFSDMLSQLQSAASSATDTRGGINPRQVGLGVNVESIDLIFTDSSPQSTGKNTDLALSGNGLFYLKDGNQSYYTRNGSFLFDEQGYYVMAGTGFRVQGWNASSEGIINNNGATTDVIVPVGKTMEAAETTQINYNGNFDKESKIIKSITYTKSTTGNADLVVSSNTSYNTRISITPPDDYTPATTIYATINGATNYSSGDNLGEADAITVEYTRGDANPDTDTGGYRYIATYKDANGNTLGTITSDNYLTEQPTIEPTVATIEDSTEVKTAASVNVDGENVVAATITFRDDTQLTVTSGYYQVGRSVPITTLATIYDSLGGKHEVTILLDKDSYSEDASLTDADAIATGKTTYTYEVGGVTHSVALLNSDSSITQNGDNYTYTKSYDVKSRTVDDTTTYYYINENRTEVEVPENDENFNRSAMTFTVTYDDVEKGDTVYDNRWRAYIAPDVGQIGPISENFENSYTRSESTGNAEADGTSTTGIMNDVNYIYFSDRGAYIGNGRNESGYITFTYGDGNGADTNQAVLDFSGLTQYANSTTSFPTTNGNTAGVLQSVAVDSNGIVSGTYTNGLIRNEAQIAVAQFTNSAGLTKVGSTIYQQSNNSGTANIRTVADFGLNVISSALEMSNVDLATEFSEMIITQRGFQANSKMTTVSDEMLETLVNMKR